MASGGSNLRQAGRSPVRSPQRMSALNPGARDGASAEGARVSDERYDRAEAIPTSPVMSGEEGSWGAPAQGAGLQPAWAPEQGGQYHQMGEGR